MTASSEIRIAVFDWGNVILKIVSSWEEACGRANLPIRGDITSPESKRRRQELAKLHQLGQIESAEFFEKISHAIDGIYSPEEFRAVHNAWLIEEFSGVSQLIDDIHAAGKATTGLLSNTTDAHWQRQIGMHNRAADFPIVSKLRHKHASHLMGLAKPDLEIYKSFEHHTGFKPANILFFDDLQENILAAKACGWNAVRVDCMSGDTAKQMRTALENFGAL